MKGAKIASYILAALILFFGVFGKKLWPAFQEIAIFLIPDELEKNLIIFFNGKSPSSRDQWGLARYLIYYPTYLLLHLLLVNSIFWESKYLRKANLIFLFTLVSLLGSALICRLLNLEYLYDMVMTVISTLLNFPLILFIIEGGRILYADLNKKLESDK